MTRSRRGADAERRALIARVDEAVRRVGAQTVVTSNTVARRFGLHTTDLEVLDLIALRNGATAGELGVATGLTSGSITALIDRLVDAGYVERCGDRADRRRVIVRARKGAIGPINAAYRPMQQRMFALWSTFSAHELETVTRFLNESIEVAAACLKEMSVGKPRRSPRRDRP